MTGAELLLWIRGPALQFATVVFVVGVTVRILEILLLGRKPDLSEARGSAVAGGLRTIFSRSIPDRGTLQRSTFNMIAGYIFHAGFFLALLFFAPHILLLHEVLGLNWPSLPTQFIDAVTVVTIITLLAVLAHRVSHKVMRFLSRPADYLAWTLTFLPLLTGYLAFHRIGLAPPMLMALHIGSVELLMIVFPFTKLMHGFTLFLARYYNGAIAGRRGVNA
jgi:nitrate reductase gamma subunit